MKSLMLFLQSVLRDLGTECCTSTTRDFKTIAGRVEHEGISFLTISLTNFGKDFEKSLDQGFVGHDQFAGYSRTGGLPRLLGGFLDYVFSRSTGRLLENPSIDCIRAIRQITLMFGKMNLPCSPARERAAFERFLECEKDVRTADATTSSVSLDAFARVGRLLWADVLSAVDNLVYSSDILPKHGPGATADRLVGNNKWRQVEWTERLDEIFPMGEYLLPSWSYYQELSNVRVLEPGAERPVRVISVPKTLKTPRIIAIEPTCMQYVQQGLMAALRDEIDSRHHRQSLIGWSSSVPNQHLAQIGSRDGSLATLDLSEASDRVSNQHVRILLRNHPHLFSAVDASRSRKADVLGQQLRLAKFASMGSALTFPFEAMVFSTIVFLGIEDVLNRPLTEKDIRSFIGRVRVYGDDIIVPVDYVHAVIARLEDFGLLVNTSKSFWTGKFRESCGKEYYNGHDVSIVRVRGNLPARRTDSSEIVRTVALRNQLYFAGLWGSAAHLDAMLEGLIPFPVVAPTSPVLGRHSFLGYVTQRSCPKLHRPLVKGLTIRDDIKPIGLDGHAALRKIFTIRGELPIPDVKHLTRSGRSHSVKLKSGWSPPF